VINRLKLEVRKLKDENYELRQKLGQTNNNLPKLKTRNYDSGKKFDKKKSN
jgi:FtsZ-binding cell division protein ZapB